MTAQFNPDDFQVGEPIILIFVENYLGTDLSLVYPNDVYAAVRGWWAIADPNVRAQDYNLVLARNSTHVLGAFRPTRWVRSAFDEGRWGFVGRPAEVAVQIRYVGRRIPERFRGHGNPILYISPGD